MASVQEHSCVSTAVAEHVTGGNNLCSSVKPKSVCDDHAEVQPMGQGTSIVFHSLTKPEGECVINSRTSERECVLSVDGLWS